MRFLKYILRFSHNTGAIIGVAVSATVGVILSVFVVFLSCARYRSREVRRYRRRQPHQPPQQEQEERKGFHRDLGRRSWNALRRNWGAGDLSPIPEGPIPTSSSSVRGRRDRMDSSANILGRTSDGGEYAEEEDKVWRPPLVGDDEEEEGGDEGIAGLGDVVRGASPTGRGGGGYGFGSGVGHTPPESGEVKSSLGHSQSWGRTSSGHGLERGALVTDSGAGMPAQAPYPYPMYVGPGPAYVSAAEVVPASGFGMYAGDREREITYAAPGDVIPPEQRGVVERDRNGEAVKGIEELVTPRTSEGDDLARSSDGTICEVAGGAMPGLERGSGSGSSRASKGTTTVRVDSTSTSRSRRSLKEVLKRFRPSSKEISSSSPSGGGVGSILAGPMLGGTAGAGGTTTHGGAETRPGYDYGAVVRPHQRQMRAFGHHHHPHLDGAGLVPPPPAILVNHAQVVHFPLLDAYPPLPAGTSTALTVDASPLPPHPYGLSADETDNEEDSLDPRGSVVRDKLLDPFFLSPSAGGSSPNIEGASLRDYVDYSRRIGGVSFFFFLFIFLASLWC